MDKQSYFMNCTWIRICCQNGGAFRSIFPFLHVCAWINFHLKLEKLQHNIEFISVNEQMIICIAWNHGVFIIIKVDPSLAHQLILYYEWQRVKWTAKTHINLRYDECIKWLSSLMSEIALYHRHSVVAAVIPS